MHGFMELPVSIVFHSFLIILGNSTYQQWGDEAFQGGTDGIWLNLLDGGKHYSQNYRWSFDYVKWRKDPNALGEDYSPSVTGTVSTGFLSTELTTTITGEEVSLSVHLALIWIVVMIAILV